MKNAAHMVSTLCFLALPALGFAQQQSEDSTAVIQSVIGAFHGEGARKLALRIHDNDPLDRHILKTTLDSMTVTARPGRVLPCAWPADNPPPGSGYDLDIKSLKMAADTAVVEVVSICDSGAANSHAPFTVIENFFLKKLSGLWQVTKREMRDL